MDSLGTPNSGVPRQLFELDYVRPKRVPEAVVLNPLSSRKISNRPGEQDQRLATRRPKKSAPSDGPVLLLSVEEAAWALGVSRSKTYELIAEGVLEAVHIGRSTRVRVAALQSFIERLPRHRGLTANSRANPAAERKL